jgi:hypothetical protein
VTTTSRETGGSGRTPRVLQVALSLNPGGTERLVVDLVRHFAGQIPMAVCCLDEVGAWASELAADGVPVTALHREAGFRPILGRAIAQAAAAHAANVIHSHQYSPFVYSCLARRVPADLHGTWASLRCRPLAQASPGQSRPAGLPP